MSPLSPTFAVRPREDQFVADLANLFRRHRVRTGSPAYLGVLASALQANSALRSDLLMLCNAISRMAESDLEPDQLLDLVAKAVVGACPVDGELPIPDELREVFITGCGEWQARADFLSAMYWGDTPEEAGETAPYTGKFAAAANRNARQGAASAARTEASEITPETRIGELTISQLRTYLDEIEQRVGRLQPYLANLQAELPDGRATVTPEARDSTRNQIRDTASDRHGESSANLPATPSNNVHRAEPAIPNTVIETTPAVAEAKPKQPADTFASRINRRQNDGILHLSLRDLPAEEQPRSADSEEPAMFRSVSEQQGGWAGGILWGAAVLLLLAPAAYFGRGYFYLEPAPMPLTAPHPPAYPPQELTPTPAVVNPAATPTPKTSTRSTSRLLPKEVHMEAQAALAEQP